MFKDVNVQEDVFHISCKEWQSPAEDAFFIQGDYLKKQRNSSKHVSGSWLEIFFFAEFIDKKSNRNYNGKLWAVKRAPWRNKTHEQVAISSRTYRKDSLENMFSKNTHFDNVLCQCLVMYTHIHMCFIIHFRGICFQTKNWTVWDRKSRKDSQECSCWKKS